MKASAPRREREIDRGARRCAEIDEPRHVLQAVRRRVARREHEVDDVVPDLVVDIDAVHNPPRGEDSRRVRHRGDGFLGRRRRHAVEDFELFVAVGVADAQLEHEAVGLRLGQRVGAFLLKGFWVASTRKGCGSGKLSSPMVTWFSCMASSSALLHLGRRPVDLVGEDEIGEDGAFAHPELARFAAGR